MIKDMQKKTDTARGQFFEHHIMDIIIAAGDVSEHFCKAELNSLRVIFEL